MNLSQKALRIFSILLISISSILISCAKSEVNVKAGSQSLHERLTKAAWEAYNTEQYNRAIQLTKKCINEFEPTAIKKQNKLRSANIPLPPEGKVTKDEKEEIFKQGLLNDVATCWFIKGRSLEKQDKKENAIQAYCKTAIYSYARIYDPSWDGFWSPSKTAKERIFFLNENCD